VLDALATRGFLVRYASPTDESELFGFIPSWKKNQFINNKEPKSHLPEPLVSQQLDACPTRDSRVNDASTTRGVKERKGKEEEDASGTRAEDDTEKPISSSMVSSAVLNELQLAGMELRVVLDDVTRMAMSAGTSADDLRTALVSAWLDYEEAKPRLSYTWGAKAFFGEGHWRNKRGWPWKPGEEQTTSRPIVQAKVDDPVGDIRAARTTSMAHIRRAMGIGGRNEPHSA
jgi:hypothetical protein